jgi:HAD superfamily hydrolase (TIGR01490 family)
VDIATRDEQRAAPVYLGGARFDLTRAQGRAGRYPSCVRLVFFDLDKTILSVNSGTLWVRREVALGHLSKRHALRAMTWLARYHFGFASAEAMVAEAVAHLAGTEAAVLRARTERFFAEEVRQTYRPGALEAIRSHRAAGERLVMLTSSSNYLSCLVAEELGFDEVLCNHLEVDAAGRHTGRVVGGVCFGAGKLPHAQRSAAAHGGGLAGATFYTDSYSDLPVLEAVGHPVAVNPDPRLRRHALKRGWRVVDWGTPMAKAA